MEKNKNAALPLFIQIKKRLPLLLPFLILALGAILRLAYLGAIPAGMHQDEAFVAWNAYALLHDGMDSAGHMFPVYMADWGDGHSAMYCWLLLPLLALNGGQVTSVISRLPQAIVAILTIWTVYLLLKRMFGVKAALWGEFLLAVCPWHIMMSRWGLDANLAPGFLIFGFYFFIRSLDDQRFLLLSALTYGMSLYCYAVIWPVVPVILLLQILYCLYHRKLSVNRWSLGASALLFVLALPLILFVFVNSGILPEIRLPFLTIPVMNGYRGGELAWSLGEMWANLRRTGSLLLHQNVGAPYDILLPYGLFYDIGRIFIVIGFLSLMWRLLSSLRRKEFSYEYFIFVQLVGAGVNVLLVWAILHQINSLYIPLVLCEAYGIWSVLSLAGRHLKSKRLPAVAAAALAGIYLVYLTCFQFSYYNDYQKTANAYFGQGLQEAVEYAVEQASAVSLEDITVEKGAQWPRLLLYSNTTAPEYLEHVVYAEPPAPASFSAGGVTFHNGIDYNHIRNDSIYLIYYTDVALFETDFRLRQFYDWYVAVPD